MRSFDLSACLARGENLHTEFKAWPIPPDDLAAAIVAFANTDGGRILLGVDDRGAAVGVGDLDRTTRFVDNVVFHNCSPPVTVLQESFEVSGNAVVSVGVPKGDDRPYRTNRGVYYVRTSSGRRHASREELLRLFQSSESLFYDENPVRRSTPDDLDEGAADEMLEAIRDQGLDVSGVPRDRLLRNWGLIAATGEQDRLTVAGLLVVKKQRIPTDRFITHECDRHTDMPWGIFGSGAVPTKTFIRSADSSCRIKTMNSSLTGGLRNARLRDGGERLRESNFSVLRHGNQR